MYSNISLNLQLYVHANWSFIDTGIYSNVCAAIHEGGQVDIPGEGKKFWESV